MSGSARTEAELGVLLERARALLEDPAHGGPELFDAASGTGPADRDGRDVWWVRTRGFCSVLWPGFSRRWDSMGLVTRYSGTW
jgi:hypothetical protein